MQQRWARYRSRPSCPAASRCAPAHPVLVDSVAELEERFPLLGRAGAARELDDLRADAGRVPADRRHLAELPARPRASPAGPSWPSSRASPTPCAQAVERSRAVASLETAVAKLSFLADATSELASSLDYRTTLAKIASLVVPRLADWCAIDLKGQNGLERVATTHVDPEKIAYAEELQRRYPPDPDAATGVPR